MNKRKAIFGIAIGILLISLSISAIWVLGNAKQRQIQLPDKITRIVCREFDESRTEYTDSEVLEKIERLLSEARFEKITDEEYYVGGYMFEFYEDEVLHYVGISRDHFIYDGTGYRVDVEINCEILRTLGKYAGTNK